MNADSNNFKELIGRKIPLMDLRAPVEFARGAFSQAVNLPLMDDLQRAKVGTCYKKHGQAAAITLGHQLVVGDIKALRLQHWQAFINEHPAGYLYCFRGGLRSATVQQWLAECGYHYPLVVGGYKALRQFMLEQLALLAKHPLLVIGGKTGVRKTAFLAGVATSLDLEAAAGHRGSSFGAFVHPPANQINFEHQLAEQYLGRNVTPQQTIVVEDEGKLIGAVHLPLSLQHRMTQSSIVVIEESFDGRLEHLFDEYIVQMSADYALAYGQERGFSAFGDYLAIGLFNIRRRLGLQRYQQLNDALTQAMSAQQQGDLRQHMAWLTPLVQHYYDPMYEYQLEVKKQRIAFRGDRSACLAYVNERCRQ